MSSFQKNKNGCCRLTTNYIYFRKTNLQVQTNQKKILLKKNKFPSQWISLYINDLQNLIAIINLTNPNTSTYMLWMYEEKKGNGIMRVASVEEEQRRFRGKVREGKRKDSNKNQK